MHPRSPSWERTGLGVCVSPVGQKEVQRREQEGKGKVARGTTDRQMDREIHRPCYWLHSPLLELRC